MENEHEIIAKSQSDPQYFVYHYKQYLPQIYNYVLYKVSNTHVAEDIVSDIFYKALKNISEYKNKGFFRAWLFTIARNTVISYHRKNNRETLYSYDNDTEHPDPVTVEDIVSAKESRAELLNIVASLPLNQQYALLLRYIEDLKIKEIAYILNKSEGAVKLLLHRGLRNLHSELSNSKKGSDVPYRKIASDSNIMSAQKRRNGAA